MRALVLYIGDGASSLLPHGLSDTMHLDESSEDIEDMISLLTDTITIDSGKLNAAPYDLVIIAATDDTGLKYLPRVIRDTEFNLPILVIASENVRENTLIELLEQGADYAMRPPMTINFFVAAASALYRMYMKLKSGPMRCGNLIVNPRQNKVTYATEKGIVHIPFTPHQISVLEVLMQNQGDVCTKEQLLTSLYGMSTERETPEVKIIDVFVCKIRGQIDEYIGQGIGHAYIRTVWGRGYVLDKPAGTPAVAIAV